MKITALPLCLIILQWPQAAYTFSVKPSLHSVRTKDSSITLLFYIKPEHQDEHIIKRAKRPSKRVYKHLFRHYGDISFDSWLRCEDPESFLHSIGYTQTEIDALSNDLPSLLTLNVHDQLAPKARFLVETLEGGEGRLIWSEDQHKIETSFMSSDDDECSILGNSDFAGDQHSLRLSEAAKRNVPTLFFACSLDREVGPYHAYLQHTGLLNGPELLAEPTRFAEFLQASKSIKSFSVLCQQWDGSEEESDEQHSTEIIGAFLDSVTKGLLPASKNGGSHIVDLLLQHGYNPLEYDAHTGVGPLHWLAGRGELSGTKSLVQALLLEDNDSSLLDLLDNSRDPKKGATPFHWAACGMTTRVQGGGGSVEVCQWIVEQVFEEGGKDAVTKLCNLPCWTNQSTPLMHAAWGGNVRLCELLIEQGGVEQLLYANKCGQNALHWAAAAGHLDVCQYLTGECHRHSLAQASTLVEKQNVGHDQILQPDSSGLTPRDYAKQYDRKDVVEWMTKVQ